MEDHQVREPLDHQWSLELSFISSSVNSAISLEFMTHLDADRIPRAPSSNYGPRSLQRMMGRVCGLLALARGGPARGSVMLSETNLPLELLFRGVGLVGFINDRETNMWSL